jgi:pimeloyl-ACP methyl ester carboxylesterase
VPARRAPLDVDGRLGCDSVTLLCNRREEQRERTAIVLFRRPDLDRRCCHVSILTVLVQDSSMPPTERLELRRRTSVTGDGVKLAVLDVGEGRPVVLLHGFPDSSYLWRRQLPALVDAGLRVIAPDLRGFGESDRPEQVEDYALSHSVRDVLAVLDALELQQACVVGHDFGAVVAWLVAAHAPERVERLVAMSVGHPNAARERSIEQREKAWYQLFFQFDVAEALLMRDDWKLMRELLRGDGDLDRYLADLSRPGALTAGLNWYRANLAPARALEERPPVPAVAATTLGLWSSGDNYLAEDGMLRSAEHVSGQWRYERIDGASHWLQLDQPERVNALLTEFLA